MKQKSRDVSKPRRVREAKVDARVERTRLKIDQAFVQLLFYRTYSSVRVHDIARKAAVGRATFYAHYTSKDDLLRSQVERIIVPMLRPVQGRPLPDCRALFQHAIEAPVLFRNIMGPGENSGSRIVRHAIEERLGTLIQPPAGAKTPAGLARRFVAGTLMTVLAHALQPGTRESADELQRYFEKLAGSGLLG